MANKFYSPDDQRAAKVNDLFATIAPRYDLINDVQSFGRHRRWKRRVAELAVVRPGDRALDLCCGTGDLALALAHRGAQVVGLDFTEQMLAVAKKRIQYSVFSVQKENRQSAIRNPQFVRGDAQRIPFPDAEFDIVTVGYGLRNLANWETGLREMARVAKPGARLLVLDFGKPDNPLWRFVYFGYLKLFVPLLGLVFCRNAGAYAYILESLKLYPAQHAVAARMRDFGLANVRIVNLLGGAMSINYGERQGAGRKEQGFPAPRFPLPAP
jgi:demethylmenaquinone methyltransferase/2-methoxy-6-polyprenyl-1,4-benzoquinol methylase